METEMKCKTCRGKLRWDQPRECWVCDHCHPQGEPKEKFDEGTVVEPTFEEKVRAIVRDELKNPMLSLDSETGKVSEVSEWRGQAKRLGIDLYDRENNRPRLKVDVVKEIEEKSNVGNSD